MDLATLLKNLCPRRSTPIVLELDLSRGVLASPADNPISALKAMNTPTMQAIRDNLHRAASDERVKGLIVTLGAAPIAPAEADELAQLIADFGRHKPTISFSATFGEFGSAVFGYRLAAAASTVWMQPSGTLSIGGLHLDITLLKSTLAKLGIQAQLGQRHEYKTAADRFAAEEVSDANREMMHRIGQSLMDSAVEAIAASRGLGNHEVWDAVNSSPLTAQQALDAGFVDGVGYRDEVYAAAHEEWGTEPSQQVFVHRYLDLWRLPESVLESRRPAVAVVDVRGAIVYGRGRATPLSQSAGSDDVCEHIRAAERDEQVKALVLCVDSPGGSYIASDAIRRAVVKFRESGRPVVAAMGNLAASGGYFVSMAANEILAQPTTLTGSIGVLSGKMVLRGLYDKIGLKREAVDIGARAGMSDPGREFTQEEWDVLNAELDRIYADFTAKAAADRGMSLEKLEPLARGRVWTGADAAKRGLIDGLGGMDLAIQRACELAQLDRDEIRLRHIGALGVLERLRPSRNSETLSAVAIGIPATGEDWVALAAEALGVHTAGVLSLPLVPRVGG